MENKKFNILWKGKICAKLDASELLEALKFGKIGLFHQIDCGDGQAAKTIKEFLRQNGGMEMLKSTAAKSVSTKKQKNNTPRGAKEKNSGKEKAQIPSNAESFTAYTISGLCFLSPFVLAALLVLDAYLLKNGHMKLALATTLIGIILSILGFLFFKALFSY